MKTDWTEEQCGRLPEQFEQLNDDTYIQRRNIHRAEPKEIDIGEPGWVCESRMISKDIYDDFMDVLNSPAQAQIVNNLKSVEEKQQLNDEAMVVVMGAIADLYETVATLTPA